MNIESFPAELLSLTDGLLPLKKLLGTLSMRPLGTTPLLCADEGTRLWSLSSNNVAQCWNVATGEELQRCTVKSKGPRYLRRFSSGVAVCDSTEVRLLSALDEPLYRAPKGYELQTLSFDAKYALLQKERNLFVETVENKHQLWNLPSQCRQAFLLADGMHVVCLLNQAATKVELRRVGKRGSLAKFQTEKSVLHAVSLEDGTVLVTTFDKEILLNPATRVTLERERVLGNESAHDVRNTHFLEANGVRACLRSSDGSVVWEFDCRMSVHSSVVGDDGRWFAIAERRGVLRVFSVEKRCEEQYYDAVEPITSLAWTSDGKGLLAAQGSFVRSWNVADGVVDRSWELSARIQGLTASPDGSGFAVLFSNGTVAGYELDADAERWSFVPDAAGSGVQKLSFRYTADGNHLLLSGSFDWRELLCFCFDVQQQKVLWRLLCGEPYQAVSLVPLHDGKQVVVGSYLRAYRVRIADGEVEETLQWNPREELCLLSEDAEEDGNVWAVWQRYDRETYSHDVFLRRWNCLLNTTTSMLDWSGVPSLLWSVGSYLCSATSYQMDVYKLEEKLTRAGSVFYEPYLGCGVSFAVDRQRTHVAIGLERGLVAIFSLPSS